MGLLVRCSQLSMLIPNLNPDTEEAQMDSCMITVQIYIKDLINSGFSDDVFRRDLAAVA